MFCYYYIQDNILLLTTSSEFCIDFLLVTKSVLLIADLITPCMKGVVPIMLVVPFSIKNINN
jgi:hypothetical protein